ncbi:hypothetical protein [Nocardioides sp.]|uniref:hypothetical protein n=1 Tax=Nocardioides sp. TaxID=35761 RepID=UPI0026020F07|nr:hypothetical protein [Nocardioides sp.]
MEAGTPVDEEEGEVLVVGVLLAVLLGALLAGVLVPARGAAQAGRVRVLELVIDFVVEVTLVVLVVLPPVVANALVVAGTRAIRPSTLSAAMPAVRRGKGRAVPWGLGNSKVLAP